MCHLRFNKSAYLSKLLRYVVVMCPLDRLLFHSDNLIHSTQPRYLSNESEYFTFHHHPLTSVSGGSSFGLSSSFVDPASFCPSFSSAFPPSFSLS